MECPTGEELAAITGSGWIWAWPGLDPLAVDYASLVACNSTPPVRCEVAQNAQLSLRVDEVWVDGLVCLGHDTVTVTLSATDPSS